MLDADSISPRRAAAATGRAADNTVFVKASTETPDERRYLTIAATGLHPVCRMQRDAVRYPIMLVALSIAACGSVVRLTAQDPPAATSVKAGVYTAAQAARGAALYDEKCTTCHAARMWGQDWPDKTVWDLYDTIKNYMPEDSPGTLTAQQARDVVAFILKSNKLPAGAKALPASDDDLKRIRLAAP